MRTRQGGPPPATRAGSAATTTPGRDHTAGSSGPRSTSPLGSTGDGADPTGQHGPVRQGPTASTPPRPAIGSAPRAGSSGAVARTSRGSRPASSGWSRTGKGSALETPMDGRAGIRPDQDQPPDQPLQTPRTGRRPLRMAPNRRHPQPSSNSTATHCKPPRPNQAPDTLAPSRSRPGTSRFRGLCATASRDWSTRCRASLRALLSHESDTPGLTPSGSAARFIATGATGA
jgi:hypothetical protein